MENLNFLKDLVPSFEDCKLLNLIGFPCENVKLFWTIYDDQLLLTNVKDFNISYAAPTAEELLILIPKSLGVKDLKECDHLAEYDFFINYNVKPIDENNHNSFKMSDVRYSIGWDRYSAYLECEGCDCGKNNKDYLNYQALMNFYGDRLIDALVKCYKWYKENESIFMSKSFYFVSGEKRVETYYRGLHY